MNLSIVDSRGYNCCMCVLFFSGHGVSGTALLNLLSFVVAPAMFGGGMATAFFMRSQGFM